LNSFGFLKFPIFDDSIYISKLSRAAGLAGFARIFKSFIAEATTAATAKNLLGTLIKNSQQQQQRIYLNTLNWI